MTWNQELVKQHALYRLERDWGQICKDILVNFGPSTHVPAFVRKFAKLLHDQEKELRRALMHGDMPWFAAWFMRLDMMENALIEINYDTERREPISRARWMLQRLSSLAKHRLEQLNGNWPPKPIVET